METIPKNWVKEIKVELEMCSGCQSCMDACFVDVIRWDDDENTPIIAYPEDCVWCLACEIACPEDCIDIIPNIPGPLRSSF